MPNPFRRAATSEADASLLIDRYLPEYDVTVVRHRVVDADPATTYRATLATDLTDLGPVVRTLGRLRDLPRAAADWLRGRPRPPSPDGMRFADVARTEGWTLLDESPDEELVVGAVGRFWRPAIEWRTVDAGEFAAFDEPGYAKLALGLSVRPYGEGRTLLSYEARTATTDERARRRFRRYWRLVRPFAGYLMSRALDGAAAAAEAMTREARAGPEASRADAGPATSRAGADGEELSRPVPSGKSDTADGSRPNSARVARLAAVGIGVTGLAAAYHFLARPRHRRWGATDREARRPLPGDDLLPDAADQVTRAVDVDAPPEVVWPWLLELGQSRGGRSGVGRLRAGLGSEVDPADRVHPKYDAVEEGDVLPLPPTDRRTSSASTPLVVRADSERALVVRPPGDPPAWTRAFVLEPTDEGTRLLARTRRVPGGSGSGPLAGVPVVGRSLRYLVGEPAEFLSERRLLELVARRAEETARREAAATG